MIRKAAWLGKLMVHYPGKDIQPDHVVNNTKEEMVYKTLENNL